MIAPIRIGERTAKKVENHAEIAWLFAIHKISKATIPKNMAVIFIFLFVSKFNVKHQLPLRDNFLSFPDGYTALVEITPAAPCRRSGENGVSVVPTIFFEVSDSVFEGFVVNADCVIGIHAAGGTVDDFKL